MRKLVIGLLSVGFIAGSAVASPAQEKADPRALAVCQEESSSFVQIEGCLPGAHVAFAVLDAFEEIYPAKAMPLKTKCIEINDTIKGASACVTNAISAAVSLSNKLPSGASLDDPVFNAAKDIKLLSLLESAEADARALFPEVMIWGGGLYQPYR